jgi:enamine deaminase RidA (YjgF/YER057c/UK114 family)
MSRERFATGGMPWIGDLPMSAAVRVGDLVFLGGHAAIAADGSVNHAGDVAAQARQAFEGLIASLEEAGGSVDDLVDVMSFNLDPSQIPEVLRVGAEFLPEGKEPAWTAVSTIGSTAPGALVVVRGIAVLGDSPRECITPEASWWSSIPASAACRKGDLVFVSGQLAVDADGQALERGSHAGQARDGVGRVAELAELAGGSLDDMIDVVSFHQDPRGMPDVAEVWEKELFAGVEPSDACTLTTIGVPGLHSRGLIGQYRAIVDLSPGARIGRAPESVWWREMPISAVTKKESGALVGIAGQVSSDGDGEILHWGDARAQAEYCLSQIDAGLEMLGGSLADVVEVTAFHKDPRDWEDVADAARNAFGGSHPAWTSVGTTGLYQEGYLHEIHALAVVEQEGLDA